MRITDSKLRQIIKEEAGLLARRKGARALREGAGFSYSSKLSLIRDAIDLLREAQVMDDRSPAGPDPDLDNLVEELEGYAEAVAVLAADEDEVVDPFVAPRAPRSMRH